MLFRSRCVCRERCSKYSLLPFDGFWLSLRIKIVPGSGFRVSRSAFRVQGLLSSPIRCALFPQLKADFLLPGSGWGHQLTNCRHEGPNRLIMGFNFAFQLGQPISQSFMGRQYFTESNESPDYKNAHLYCPVGIKNCGQHNRPIKTFPHAKAQRAQKLP